MFAYLARLPNSIPPLVGPVRKKFYEVLILCWSNKREFDPSMAFQSRAKGSNINIILKTSTRGQAPCKLEVYGGLGCCNAAGF